jgi:hypothetical protein
LDTGGIESVVFDGTSVDPSAYTNNEFSGGAIEQVGFQANSNSGSTTAFADNFSVVPEPSSFGLLSALAAFGWVLSRRRR